MKIVKSLEDLLINYYLTSNGVSKTIQNKAKEQKGGFLSMLLGTLGASLLGNILASKEMNRTREGLFKVAYGSSIPYQRFLIPPHPLINFEIQKHYQNDPMFNGVYSRDNLPYKLKDRAYVINLDEYSDIGTRWNALYALNNNITYFGSFGVEHIPKEIKIFIDKSIVVTNISRIQAYDSVMCRYFCIGFIDSLLSGKTLTDFTNLIHQIIIRRMMI